MCFTFSLILFSYPELQESTTQFYTQQQINDLVSYAGAERNKSYSRGWISVSLQLKIKKGSTDLCHTVAILSQEI